MVKKGPTQARGMAKNVREAKKIGRVEIGYATRQNKSERRGYVDVGIRSRDKGGGAH